MNKIRLLDCTLRDGGYVNDWEFGSNTITNVYSRLNASGIEVIELGFLNKDYPFDINRTIMPHTKYFNEVYRAKIKPNAMRLAMVIMGECGLDGIGLQSETIIDGLRIVFKKSKIDEAFEFAKVCRERGYKIFFQPASITDYSDEEMVALVKKANAFKPVAFYMVDTYGLLDKKRMFRYADLIDKNLDKDIIMGYHSHNNFQLSYSTAMEFIEREKVHDIIVDCTLFGMGKGTGNLNTELIIDYMNKNGINNYDNMQVLEAIDSEISKIKKKFEWGYSLNAFISASNDCHPKYVNYLLKKRSLSIMSVNTILKKIDKNNLTIFNKDLIEKLFLEYQSVAVDDRDSLVRLAEELREREILILATGGSLNREADKINVFIAESNPIIISVNHNPSNYKINYCFINNAVRYNQMSLFVNNDIDAKIIATSNIIQSSRHIDYPINYANLIVDGDVEIVSANATLMLFKLLRSVGVDTVNVAGFDGFSHDIQANYCENYLSYNTNEDMQKQNTLIGQALKDSFGDMNINFLTKTNYVL